MVVTKGRPKENTNNRRRDDVESGEEERKRKRFRNNFKNPKHSPYFFFVGKDPKKLVEKLEKSHTKTSIRAAFRTSLALAFVMGFANVWGSHPKDNAKGGRAWYAVVLALDSDFFFRVKCDASHLVYFFLAAVKGFRAMEGANETDAKAWEWTATRKCATRNVFDWIFFSCRRHAGGVDGRWSPFLRAFFFFLFSPLLGGRRSGEERND